MKTTKNGPVLNPIGNLDVNVAFNQTMTAFNEIHNGRRMADYVIAGILDETTRKYADMVDVSKGNERVRMEVR